MVNSTKDHSNNLVYMKLINEPNAWDTLVN